MATSKRSHLSQAEVASITALVADVAARKANLLDQRQRLIDGLCEAVGANCGFTYVAEGWMPGGNHALLSSVNLSGTSDFFARYVHDVIAPEGVAADPFCTGTVGLPGPVVSVTRDDVMPDVTAERRHPAFTACAGALKLRDGIVSFFRTDMARGAITGVGVHRLDADQRFTDREHAMIRFAIEALARLVGSGELPLPELEGKPIHAAQGLSLRLHEVLEHVLAGENARQVAHRLGLSVTDVREHVATLFGHFGVDNRDALIEQFADVTVSPSTAVANFTTYH